MTRNPDPTKTAYHQLGQQLRALEPDLRWGLRESRRIPAAWTEIAQAPIIPPKVKVTLRLDSDVVKFFNSMGRGHLTRINAVLRTFMLARLAEVIRAVPDYAPSDWDQEGEVIKELEVLLKAEQAAEEAKAEEAEAGARLRKFLKFRDEMRAKYGE